jgi:hypothetical protein
MSGLVYDYSTKVLNGGVVRLSGMFYGWHGTITVRPGEDGGEPTVAYSSHDGPLPKRVEALALAAYETALR